MKTTYAIAVIAAAILSLQQSVAAKSSLNDSQSVLDPLTIQEDTARDAVTAKRNAKHNKFQKHSKSLILGKSSKGLHTASTRQNNQRSMLSGAYELPSVGALSGYQKVPGIQAKTASKHTEKKQKKLAAKQRSSLAWNGSTNRGSTNQRSAANSGKKKKNIFQSSADATGKVITAPARGLRALFKPKSSQN